MAQTTLLGLLMYLMNLGPLVKELKLELTKSKSKAQVQISQDNCDDMVKKLEKGSNVTSSAPRQGQVKENCLVQSKESSMEYNSSTCSMKPKNKTKLSRRQKYRAKTRVHCRCKEKGHLIAACPIQQSEAGSDLTGQTGWCLECPTSFLQVQAKVKLKGET